METWIEINLSHLKNNYEYIRNRIKSDLCAVVKADGYGMGLYEISTELEKLGTDYFAVAFLNEGINLRREGIKKEILVFNYVDSSQLHKALEADLILTIYSIDQLKSYIDIVGADISKLRFHVKINSGMNRLGIDEKDFVFFMDKIKEYDIRIEGLYSHFAEVEDFDFSKKQYEKFLFLADKFEKLFEVEVKKHISNSPASLLCPDYNLDMVRVGMLLYGLQPLEEKDENIKEIFTWKSRISSKRVVAENERISYGNYTLNKKKIIATVPVGYSHGYMRQLSNRASVIVGGRRFKIIGDICMDQMIIDITGSEDIFIGDEVTLLGGGVSAESLGTLAGTIADDVICKISPKIERVLRY